MVDIGKRRITRLLNIRKQTKRDLISHNNLINKMIKLKLLNEDEEIIGNLALRMTASLSKNRFFLSWLIEKEGDFFSICVSQATNEEIMTLLKFFFRTLRIGLRNVVETIKMDHSEIVANFNAIFNNTQQIVNEKVISIKFWEIPTLLKKKKGFLTNGWLVSLLDFLIPEMKWKYQKILQEKINELNTKREILLKDPTFMFLSNEIISFWNSERNKFFSSSSSISTEVSGNLWEKKNYFPLCMRLLQEKLENTGYLTHGERLQLGLFLKKLGMPLDEQMKMWYSHAVDNTGISWDEFERKAGYIIKHIYGLVGGKKDYAVPKCDTIISKYFCPFHNLNAENLKQILKNIFPKTSSYELIQQIINLAESSNPKNACWYYLRLLTNRRLRDGYISHPIQFFNLALKLSRRSFRKKK